MATKNNQQLTAEQRRAFGLRVMHRRRSMRWSQRELGRRTGIRYVRVSKLENGHVTPTVAELVLIAEVLNAGLDELVRGLPPVPATPAILPAGSPERPLPLAELEELGSPEEWAVLGKLLRSLVAGLKLGTRNPAGEA
jgi:transcriptional regulator with XRE-family HTH domain